MTQTALTIPHHNGTSDTPNILYDHRGNRLTIQHQPGVLDATRVLGDRGLKNLGGRIQEEYLDVLKSWSKQVAIFLEMRDQPTIVLIENRASGQSLIQDLRRIPIPVLPVNPDADKYRRASSVTGLVQSGLVHLPSYADIADKGLWLMLRDRGIPCVREIGL